MNIFQKAKAKEVQYPSKRRCDFCGVEYKTDLRNLKRGWGLCCSKSCAAEKRSGNKGYSKKLVRIIEKAGFVFLYKKFDYYFVKVNKEYAYEYLKFIMYQYIPEDSSYVFHQSSINEESLEKIKPHIRREKMKSINLW